MIILGSFCGALILSALTYFFHKIFVSQLLADGQYAMIFLLTMPMGAILGFGTVYTSILLIGQKVQQAGQVCKSISGFVLILLVILFTFYLMYILISVALSIMTSGIFASFLGFTVAFLVLLPLFGLPLIWAGLLSAWANRLLSKS